MADSYCNALADMSPADLALHKPYHDKHYGFPIQEDNELFCRLILEINQAGLSWTTILWKQENFRKAYSGFDIKKVAKYGEKDRHRLMNDEGIIRNRLKIDAAITNAKKIVELQKHFGSFRNWLDAHHPLSRKEWTSLFKKTFYFTGGEIVNEFLVSTGYLPGAHTVTCPIFQKAKKLSPAWTKKVADA